MFSSRSSLLQSRSFFFFQAEDGIRYKLVTGVQTCALPILARQARAGPERQRRIGAREVVEGEPAAAAERHVGGVAEPTTEPEGERQRQPAGGRDEGARG